MDFFQFAKESAEQTCHLRAYDQHQETVQKFEKDLRATYGQLPARDSERLFIETWRRLEAAEGDERKKMEDTQEALVWIRDSILEEGTVSELGYAAPWERLHPDSPGPFLSLGTHFWALIIGNDNYPSDPDVPSLSGCINDAHLVKDHLKKYLQVPEDHITLLENASRKEMIDALYNLRDNKRIPFGDNILIHYSGYMAQITTLAVKDDQFRQSAQSIGVAGEPVISAKESWMLSSQSCVLQKVQKLPSFPTAVM